MELCFVNENFGFRLQAWRIGDGRKSCEQRDGRAFLPTVMNEIENRRGKVAAKTMENELTAVRSFCSFTGRGLTMAGITPELIRTYERWMREKGLKPGTAALYLRSLRAVLNRCGADGTRLFNGVHTGGVRTEKRSISEKDLMKIVKAELPPDSSLARARELFLFSLIGMGMAPVDMAFLKKSDIKEGRIEYQRRKTGVSITADMVPILRNIANHYSGTGTPYLFPLLKSTDPQEAEREYRRFLNWYNRKLAKLSGILGLERRITSYTSRHTWASLAFRYGVDLAFISKGLGHTNPLTTRAYLKEIDNTDLGDANRRLLTNIGLFFENI